MLGVSNSYTKRFCNTMLDNKTILVTGASGILGQAACKIAGEHGAKTIEFDLAFTLTQDNRYEVDLTEKDSVQDLIEKLEPIDVVFNIAGGFAMGPTVHETAADEWDRMYKMNVVTALNVIEAVVPKMQARGRGAIVNVGAMSAREGQANMGAYISAKSTIMRLTESMAKELKHEGINVNAVLPNIIDTPANRAGMPDEDFKSWVSPESLANVMCFLASDSAAAVHGALVPVSGLS